MIGPLVNAVSIISGGLLGAIAGEKIPQSVRERMPLVLGLLSIGIGVSMAMKVNLLPAVTLAILFGTILGEIFQLEKRIQSVAHGLKGAIERVFPKPNASMEQNEYIETFISVLVLFSVSGMGVFGAMNEALTGDPTYLIIKSFLDFLTAAIFAARLGFPIASLAMPQTLVQTILYFSAFLIMPLTNASMIGDFSFVGGMVMIATGFRICGVMQFPVVNMLPALIIVMPISALWTHFVI